MSKTKKQSTLLAFSFALTLLNANGTACWAVPAVSNNQAGNAELNQMEIHFFEHPYPGETEENRLARLEKMVFGKEAHGSNQQRLAHLVSVIPPETTPANVGRSSGQQQYGQQQFGQMAPEDQSGYAPPPPARRNAGGSSPYATGNSQAYTASGYSAAPPSAGNTSVGLGQVISAQERQVLGESHEGQPLPFRVTALENAIFSNTADHTGSLSERVGRLNSALGMNNGADPAAPAPAQYQKAYTSREVADMQQKNGNGHPKLKTAAKVAVVVGAVAGVAALTVLAVHGMGRHHDDD